MDDITDEALYLHLAALINSQVQQRTGFVTDRWLSDFYLPPTTEVAELVLAGLWERTTGGYYVTELGAHINHDGLYDDGEVEDMRQYRLHRQCSAN